MTRIPRAVGVTAYRIIQEALTNTTKHSDAQTVSVSVQFLANQVQVEATDDGITLGRTRRTSRCLPKDKD